MDATPKHLIGRKIVAVDLQPFDDRCGGTAHDPILTLDNGRKVWFVTEETDTGDYGVAICISAARKRGAKTRRVEVAETQRKTACVEVDFNEATRRS
jgi:hypothetical protein